MTIGTSISSLCQRKENPSHHATGPRTPAGIENCKYNATRHGLTGNQVVIRGEDPAEYDALHKALVEEHQPASEDQAMLVEVIAENWWKLGRASRYERDIFEHSFNEDVFSSKRFLNYARYRAGIQRTWNSARRELATLKAAALAAQEAAAAQETANAQELAAPTAPAQPKPAPLVQKVGSTVNALESVSYFDVPIQIEPRSAAPISDSFTKKS